MSGEASAALSATPMFTAAIAVRWRDLDAFNHVNNSTYLTYLEESRLQWMLSMGDVFDPASTPVLAASELNYRRPIAWPAQVQVQLLCERLGNSSITVAHRIVDAGDPERLYCDGRVVMVWIDPQTGRSVPLPTSVRSAAGRPA
ncbi:putative thioesterase [Rhodanobacter fulvus Jip2]|uniref:Putative thioesterase n=1 Tax=Rhodanobacter fulvus Jip2 TaxID=1163408 RepID=I4VPE8_9GAMM|nr:thioesterase family protein [Rhodanobacter fulvus]EIL89089.1 putative thioesterase [Rhodanobacter fulvus Jip2]